MKDIKSIIKNILIDAGKRGINLGSEAACDNLAGKIVISLKVKGVEPVINDRNYITKD